MSDPTGYTPDYSFSGFQANNPTTPLPAANIDAQLAEISVAVASLVAAVKDIRRSDGALKNQIVTYASLEQALQLLVDPTNGQAVAAAVATAQAAAAAASASSTSAGTSATNAANSAAAAAASASSVNLSLFLSKAGNLAGLGNVDTSLANLAAMKNDGTNAVGRLAKTGNYAAVTDWNNVIDSGWYAASPGTPNAPDSVEYWLVHVMAADAPQFYVTQVAYRFAQAAFGPDSVLMYRRHSYNNGGTRSWTPWISNGAVPVGSTIWVNGTSAPPGYLKENGALLSRAAYPALWTFANNSGNIVTEASWAGGNTGAFSSGDLSTTFRLPDARGEFIRAYDDSRGVDSGRVLGAHQADTLKDHTHTVPNQGWAGTTGSEVSGTLSDGSNNGPLRTITSSSPSTGAASETRPRNNAKLACIKY